jgi:hypothetical protein
VGQPGAALDDTVELVAVKKQQPPAVGGSVDVVQMNGKIAEPDAVVIPEDLIVVAGNVNDPGAVLCLAEYGANDVIVTLGPVEPVTHIPYVDDVSDEEKIVATAVAEKVEKESSLAALEAEMDIRDENAAKPHGAQRTDFVHAVLR